MCFLFRSRYRELYTLYSKINPKNKLIVITNDIDIYVYRYDNNNRKQLNIKELKKLLKLYDDPDFDFEIFFEFKADCYIDNIAVANAAVIDP